MSFRIEEKLRVDKSKLFDFKNWLLSKGGKKLYEKRKISSIYFDNSNFQIHNDSVEGVLPRHKIRLRFYNDKMSNNQCSCGCVNFPISDQDFDELNHTMKDFRGQLKKLVNLSI